MLLWKEVQSEVGSKLPLVLPKLTEFFVAMFLPSIFGRVKWQERQEWEPLMICTPPNSHERELRKHVIGVLAQK